MDVTTNLPKALFFDVFGTVVDWRRTVVAYLDGKCAQTLNGDTSIPATTRSRAQTTPWATFAQDWRTAYTHFTAAYQPSESPAYKTIDEHHHDSLKVLLEQYGLTDLWPDAEEVHEISRIWHALDAWPDCPPGLTSLNALGFRTSTLSNGNTALLADLCEHASLPFTVITSAEEFGAYKPHPSVYLGACEKLDLRPEECALVAALLGDLKAARSSGMRTVYVQREEEEAWGVERVREAREEGWVDLWVEEGKGGLMEVAKRLGRRM